MVSLPEKFEQSVRIPLGEEFPHFLKSLREPAPVSVRLHPLKNNHAIDGRPVLWSTWGRYLPSRPSFTFDPLFHGGSYYVQEASSMFLEQAIRQSVDVRTSLKVLDLCAAPGGKATHILSLISRDSLLVSNEVIRSRASILSQNIQKWGYPNAIVTQNDPSDFQRLPGYFDVMVVDAPCSGEGMFRKDPEAIKEWSPENVQLCCGRQKRILSDAWPALREDGVLIYCTCTYNRQENEENLKWLRENFPVEPIRLQTEADWGIQEVNTDGIFCYRFFPHRVSGEGFFLAVLRKTGRTNSPRTKTREQLARPLKKVEERLHGWILRPQEAALFQFNDLVFFTPRDIGRDIEFLVQQLRIVYAGTNLATLKHEKLIPDHALALSVELNRETFTNTDVDEAQALSYLRRESIILPETPPGFSLITFKDLPIGWVNVLPNRVNSLYPQGWRIRG